MTSETLANTGNDKIKVFVAKKVLPVGHGWPNGTAIAVKDGYSCRWTDLSCQ